MLHAYEASSEPALLMVARDGEAGRLLGILLEGFGFRVLECHDQGEVRATLERELPALALLDAGLEDARQSMALIQERGELPVLLLVGKDAGAGEPLCTAFGASAWERLESRPDGILRALRGLLVPAEAR